MFTRPHSPYAIAIPMPPLRKTTMSVSQKNCQRICRDVAPTALRTPISRVRSRTATIITFMTPIPPRKSVVSPTAPRKFFIPSVMLWNCFAFSTVSQIGAASSSRGSNSCICDSALRTCRFASSLTSIERGTTMMRSTESGFHGAVFGKSRSTDANGMNTFDTSCPS